jgi:hypothetical protein
VFTTTRLEACASAAGITVSRERLQQLELWVVAEAVPRLQHRSGRRKRYDRRAGPAGLRQERTEVGRPTPEADDDHGVAGAQVGQLLADHLARQRGQSYVCARVGELLAQVQGQLKTSELPRLDETMAALATAAAGR